MPLEDAKWEDSAAWWLKARGDLAKARHALTANEPFRDDAVYHCQQAIEKAMKSLLTWHDVPFRKTHSLEELGRQCVVIDQSLLNLVDQAVPLSEYAWTFRYPGELQLPGQFRGHNTE
jgi:HEPN domain-containing protein